jgi:hypothetical protein
MPNRPRQHSSTLTFDRDEWEMLVTLPRRVLIAASAAEVAQHERSVDQGVAGIEAIASGHGSSSRLVRDVVAAIFAESYHVAGAGQPAGAEPSDGDALQTLAACRYASEVLSQRCASADAAAYRSWLHHIAAAATRVQRRAPVTVGGRVAVAESNFLYALDGILRP